MKEQRAKPNEWVMWALAEAGARTLSLTISKAVGLNFVSFGDSVLATLIIGFVQMVGAAILARTQGYRLWLGPEFSFWCVLAGISGTLQNIILLLAFGAGADLTKYLFIVVALSIIPGSLIDTVFFNVRFSVRGWTGIASAIIGGYAMFGFPSLGEILTFPQWVDWALIAMLLFAGNQGISRVLSNLEKGRPDMEKAIARNVVVGVVSITICTFALPFIGFSLVTKMLATPGFVIGAAAIGLCVICLAAADLMAYQRGAASISIKKVVANGTFLTLIAFSGHVFFGDRLGWEKFLGIALYVAAFFLINAKNKKENNKK